MSWKLGLKNSIRTKKLHRQNIIKKALRGSSEIYDVEKLKALGPWTTESFKEDLSKVFPSIVALVKEGVELPVIEAAMGLKRDWLSSFFHRYRELLEVIREARKAKTDRIRMSEIPTEETAR